MADSDDPPGGRGRELRDAVVRALEDRDSAGLRELIDAVDADPRSVFVRVRELEDEGTVRSVDPGVYALAEAAGEGRPEGTTGAGRSGGASAGGGAGTSDSPQGPSEPDDDGFEWRE